LTVTSAPTTFRLDMDWRRFLTTAIADFLAAPLRAQYRLPCYRADPDTAMATYAVSMVITRPPCFVRDDTLVEVLRKACNEVKVRPLDLAPTRLIVRTDPVGIHMLEQVLRETVRRQNPVRSLDRPP
jgi:hypothetical protein